MTTKKTIRNLQDLCDYFSADTPASLNKRVYKGTDCGASISLHLSPDVYVSLGPITVWEGFDCCGRGYQGTPNIYSPKGKRQMAKGVAVHACPTCKKKHTVRRVEKPLEVPARGAWIHNGDGLWEKLTPETPILSFTIQTIVEGSEATVDSDEFTLPVTQGEIDAWIKQMEQEASDLWQEANGDDNDDAE